MLRAAIAAVTLLAAPAAASAQTTPPQPAAPAPMPAVGAPLSLEQAQAVMAAAMAEARRQNWTMAVAVVEPNGALVAFERMDGTQYASMQVAQDKARSSALFRRSTRAFSDSVASGRVQVLTLTGAVAIEGGVPLVIGGRLVGAVGVSGGTAEQDGVVAAAGASALR